MDADIQIMVAGTVQTDCQVCDSVTVSFLTHGFRHSWLDLVFPFAFECGGAELLWGAVAAADGSKFPLSRWSQGRIKPPNSEGEAGFAFFAHCRQKCRRRPATICIAHFLVLPSSSWFESCVVVAAFLAYSK